MATEPGGWRTRSAMCGLSRPTRKTLHSMKCIGVSMLSLPSRASHSLIKGANVLLTFVIVLASAAEFVRAADASPRIRPEPQLRKPTFLLGEDPMRHGPEA